MPQYSSDESADHGDRHPRSNRIRGRRVGLAIVAVPRHGHKERWQRRRRRWRAVWQGHHVLVRFFGACLGPQRGRRRGSRLQALHLPCYLRPELVQDLMLQSLLPLLDIGGRRRRRSLRGQCFVRPNRVLFGTTVRSCALHGRTVSRSGPRVQVILCVPLVLRALDNAPRGRGTRRDGLAPLPAEPSPEEGKSVPQPARPRPSVLGDCQLLRRAHGSAHSVEFRI
ncbi:hypothetical protein DFJ74DRAFT_683568 [Hyaloraphidium curvatum]|nr:hypothetical protein DFJ74DRAFT_683568 [Hyaloraphidium curvatum]